MERSRELNRNRRDLRHKRWREKMRSMRQGTKKVRSVTEEKIQWDSPSQREGTEAIPAERAETPLMRKT